ncbi:hypothetical protein [Cupriavidus sp. UYPR2.512]|uniref:hypothetical protein n=1 Tax=Cupriavidus sp. UYPR2.512 TaxID=1080187 RepID=UPI000369B783|nr:hypothetical protein [Cupriavidus sp. UYPR2.512]UIF90941.1 hypothetical protein KAF44_32675 [Cupriavidus necator]
MSTTNAERRFEPQAFASRGADLPRKHDSVRSDFYFQHMAAGWRSEEIHERYRDWAEGVLPLDVCLTPSETEAARYRDAALQSKRESGRRSLLERIESIAMADEFGDLIEAEDRRAYLNLAAWALEGIGGLMGEW